MPPVDPDPDDDDGRTTLLGMPAEMRNNIYQHVIDDDPPAIRTRRKTNKIAIDSAMIYVNKQISQEFLSLALGTSSELRTRVHDYNFNHVAAFLNEEFPKGEEGEAGDEEEGGEEELSDDEEEETNEEEGEDDYVPELTIHITLSTAEQKQLDVETRKYSSRLRRWLDRMDDPGHSHEHVVFKYN